MSTYWYLECTDHEPPLRADSESEQHTHGLSRIREIIAKKDAYIAAYAAGIDVLNGEYFENNTVSFLLCHPKCHLRLVSEYGDIESTEQTP